MNRSFFSLSLLSILMFFSCHSQIGEEQIGVIENDLINGTKTVINIEIARNGEICFETKCELIYKYSDSLGKGQMLLEEVDFPTSSLECSGFWVTPFIRVENSFDEYKGAWRTLFKCGTYISSKEMTCNNQDDFSFLETTGYKRFNHDVTEFPNQYLRTLIWEHTGENVLIDKVDSLWVWKQEDFDNIKSFFPIWCSKDEYTIRMKSERMAIKLDID